MKIGQFENGLKIEADFTGYGDCVKLDGISNTGEKLYSKSMAFSDLIMYKILYEKLLSEKYNEINFDFIIKLKEASNEI